jgi:hypothetical protein
MAAADTTPAATMPKPAASESQRSENALSTNAASPALTGSRPESSL